MTFKEQFLIGLFFIIMTIYVVIPFLLLEDTAANPITHERIVELYSND